MKSIVILFDEKNIYENERVFNGKTALELTKSVFEDINKENVYVLKDLNTLPELLNAMCELVEKTGAENVVFSFADCPFINKKLIQRLYDSHIEYKAEYTFADGFSYGFAPEVINSGTLKILKELSKKTQSAAINENIKRDSIFELIKTDINSFEIETILAKTDWRMNRFAFHCGKKENFTACKELFNNINTDEVEEIEKIAANLPGVIKNLPGFYNIQICDGLNVDSVYSPYKKAYEEKNKLSPLNIKSDMPFNDFSKLIDSIAEFSGEAVIGFSSWGEPLNHPDIIKMIEKVLSYKGLSVYLETDGLKVTESFCNELKNIVDNAEKRTNGWEKVMAAVILDAASEEKYKEIHLSETFDSARNAVSLLYSAIPGNVYPMFTRMNLNEDELESFFRYWNEKTNPSGGQLIIQKYDDYAGLLPPCKPADLSPIERNVCWHLRRDVTILSNGDVPLCHSYVLQNIIGNVFKDSLEEIWKKSDDLLKAHMGCSYNEKCGKCDEYYTFNF